ncbi:MAG: hypothetical protein EBZ60_08230, partial [Betaproteobacteria bacterium]|nr:hypothetical protein [Betaproteobacteria bacterium]
YVNPARFYNFTVKNNKAKAITTEVTLDLNYHFLVNDKADLAAFGSVGSTTLDISGNEGDMVYRYYANGAMVRAGAKARYYLTKRFGLLAMFSVFHATYHPDASSTMGGNISTTLTGHAMEFGFCYRVRR